MGLSTEDTYSLIGRGASINGALNVNTYCSPRNSKNTSDTSFRMYISLDTSEAVGLPAAVGHCTVSTGPARHFSLTYRPHSERTFPTTYFTCMYGTSTWYQQQCCFPKKPPSNPILNFYKISIWRSHFDLLWSATMTTPHPITRSNSRFPHFISGQGDLLVS